MPPCKPSVDEQRWTPKPQMLHGEQLGQDREWSGLILGAQEWGAGGREGLGILPAVLCLSEADRHTASLGVRAPRKRHQSTLGAVGRVSRSAETWKRVVCSQGEADGGRGFMSDADQSAFPKDRVCVGPIQSRHLAGHIIDVPNKYLMRKVNRLPHSVLTAVPRGGCCDC